MLAAETDGSEVTHHMAETFMGGRKKDPFESLYEGLEGVSDNLVRKVSVANFLGEMKIGTLTGFR